jgi:hypothetical protein
VDGSCQAKAGEVPKRVQIGGGHIPERLQDR